MRRVPYPLGALIFWERETTAGFAIVTSNVFLRLTQGQANRHRDSRAGDHFPDPRADVRARLANGIRQ